MGLCPKPRSLLKKAGENFTFALFHHCIIFHSFGEKAFFFRKPGVYYKQNTLEKEPDTP